MNLLAPLQNDSGKMCGRQNKSQRQKYPLVTKIGISHIIKWCSIKAVPRSYLNNKIQTNVCKTKYMYKPLFFSGETDASSFSTAKSSDKHIQLTGNSQMLK